MVEAKQQELMDDHLRSIAGLGADYWWHHHRYQVVRQAIPREARRVLDYGCGSGTFLRWLAAQGKSSAQLTGYDVSASTADLVGAKRDGDAVAARLSLLSTWPIAGATFDCIVAMDVIEHIDDDGACLRSLAGALSEDGRLLLTVPAYQLFWSSWDQRLGHFRRYSPAQLRQTLEQAGFELERSTLLFAFLVPFAFWRRWSHSPEAAAAIEFPPVPRWLNTVLGLICGVERRFLQGSSLSLGTSLFVVAKKRRSAKKLEVVRG